LLHFVGGAIDFIARGPAQLGSPDDANAAVAAVDGALQQTFGHQCIDVGGGGLFGDECSLSEIVLRTPAIGNQLEQPQTPRADRPRRLMQRLAERLRRGALSVFEEPQQVRSSLIVSFDYLVNLVDYIGDRGVSAI
jgi:hypothetical protein